MYDWEASLKRSRKSLKLAPAYYTTKAKRHKVRIRSGPEHLSGRLEYASFLQESHALGKALVN